jgi:4-hydroxy-2-oxoheptanedioate aldolase
MSLQGFSLAQRLRGGEIVHSAWCSLASPLVTEVVAREGFPAVAIDAQHGLWDIAGIVAAIAAIRHGGAAPIVRVPVGDYGTVSRALDFGAEGIVAPMINNARDARAFVAAAKFPPLGERSWGPNRATMLGGITDQKQYLAQANEAIVTLAMIETREALENLNAIASTPGIDGLFLGPSDLSITLSDGQTLEPQSPEVERELDRIVAAARKAGKIPGVYCATPERAVALAGRGVTFMAIANDLTFLRASAAAALKVLKG